MGEEQKMLNDLYKIMKMMTLFLVMATLIIIIAATANFSLAFDSIAYKGLIFHHVQLVEPTVKHETEDKMPNAYKEEDWIR